MTKLTSGVHPRQHNPPLNKRARGKRTKCPYECHGECYKKRRRNDRQTDTAVQQNQTSRNH